MRDVKIWYPGLGNSLRTSRKQIQIPEPSTESQWNPFMTPGVTDMGFETLYDEVNNQIYTLSAGGTLWKGAIDGSNWEVKIKTTQK